jgi:hypothetical protein
LLENCRVNPDDVAPHMIDERVSRSLQSECDRMVK